jgi:hypothetical protein
MVLYWFITIYYLVLYLFITIYLIYIDLYGHEIKKGLFDLYCLYFRFILIYIDLFRFILILFGFNAFLIENSKMVNSFNS